LAGKKETDLKIKFTRVCDAARIQMQVTTEDTFCEEICYILLTALTLLKCIQTLYSFGCLS